MREVSRLLAGITSKTHGSLNGRRHAWATLLAWTEREERAVNEAALLSPNTGR